MSSFKQEHSVSFTQPFYIDIEPDITPEQMERCEDEINDLIDDYLTDYLEPESKPAQLKMTLDGITFKVSIDTDGQNVNFDVDKSDIEPVEESVADAPSNATPQGEVSCITMLYPKD